MNHTEQTDRAIRMAHSAQRRIAVASRKQMPHTYSYAHAMAIGMLTIASCQVTLGNRVEVLRNAIRNYGSSDLAVSELMALVRLSNASLVDYFAIVDRKTGTTRGVGNAYVTTKRLTDAELCELIGNWYDTHGVRMYEIMQRFAALWDDRRKAMGFEL